MNRAQRRAAAHAKPTGPAKVVPLPKILDEFAIFDDLDRIFQKLENEAIEYANGVPVFMSATGEWSEVVPNLNSWISCWKRYDQQFRLGHDLSAMVRLCNCLHYGKPLAMAQIKAAKAVLMEQRRLFKTMNRKDVAKTARVEQTAQYLMDKVA